jgi:hypothetical protein
MFKSFYIFAVSGTKNEVIRLNIIISRKITKSLHIMKILVIKSIFLLVVASFIILLATQCKKEPTEITAIITVKYQNDTNLVVPFADVVIGETGQDVMVQGKADALGQYSHVFKLEAIFVCPICCFLLQK